MNYNLLWKKQDRYRKKNNIEHHILLLQNVDQLATVRISLTLSRSMCGLFNLLPGNSYRLKKVPSVVY